MAGVFANAGRAAKRLIITNPYISLAFGLHASAMLLFKVKYADANGGDYNHWLWYRASRNLLLARSARCASRFLFFECAKLAR